MKVETFTADRSRIVLAHMVMSTPVLSGVSARWTKDGLFSSTWENLIASWCIANLNTQGRAPKKGIRSYYADWAETSRDRETPKLVDRFLGHIADDWEANHKLSSGRVLDIAGKHFNLVLAERHKEQVEAAIESGRPEEVVKLTQSYAKIEMGDDSFVDVFQDREALEQAFAEESTESLITFDSPLDRFFAHMLTRQSFVALQAPEKSFKSYWLAFLAYKAMLNRKRVAFFAVGDLTRREMLTRIAELAAGRPTLSDKGKWPLSLRIPTSIKPPAFDDKPPDKADKSTKDDKAKAAPMLPKVEYETQTFDRPLSAETGWAAFERTMAKRVRSKRPYFRLSCHPSDTLSVVGIRDKLREWASAGWEADVVVCDYADILAPPPGFWKDERDSTNKTWKAFKALAQERHCLVLTATQADAGSYERRSQGMKNYSTDKRKYAHVDGMVALNVTDAEREIGSMRLAWLRKRRGRFSTRRECYVAGNLAIASPAIVAAF